MRRNQFCQVFLLFVTILMAGCNREDLGPITPEATQDTPEHVLGALSQAYSDLDIDAYTRLLADDFVYVNDEDTRVEKQLPVFINRFEDSTRTAGLFAAPRLKSIGLQMTYQPQPVPVTETGREDWVTIQATDILWEFELKPTPDYPNGRTIQVDGGANVFYFRKGLSEADAKSNSPTSQIWYIVQWRGVRPRLPQN